MTEDVKKHNPYPQGGEPSDNRHNESDELPPSAQDAGWLPGRKGQGGEGLSKGYGGSEGPGTGPSGPQNESYETEREEDACELGDLHPAGHHARPETTDEEATPGTGALPEADQKGIEPGTG